MEIKISICSKMYLLFLNDLMTMFSIFRFFKDVYRLRMANSLLARQPRFMNIKLPR